MKGQPRTYARPIGIALAVVLGASAGAGVVGVLPPQTQISERGAQAWAERLTGQAEVHRQARVADAYALRLAGIHQELVSRTWTDRLTAQADALGGRGMSDRAARAWTDRLDGLAEAKAAE